MTKRKPDAQATRAIIEKGLKAGQGYKAIIDEAHQRGLGCSTQQIVKMKRKLNMEVSRHANARGIRPVNGSDPILGLIDALKGMGVIEFHLTSDQVIIVRRQTLEIK